MYIELNSCDPFSPYIIADFPAILGSHPDADVRFGGEGIAKYHCELAVEEGCIKIFDLGSQNGTLLNGQRISEAILHSGDVVVIGRRKFEIKVVPSPAADTKSIGSDA